MSRNKRYNKRDSKRVRQLYESFRNWLSQQSCCVSGRPAPNDAHHVRSWSASRQHFNNMVPLSRLLHKRFHDLGKRTFEERYAVDLSALAHRYTDMFVIEKGYKSLDHMLEEHRDETSN